MIEISSEDALREACTALGESIVRERLLAKHATEMESLLRRHAEAAQAAAEEPAKGAAKPAAKRTARTSPP